MATAQKEKAQTPEPETPSVSQDTLDRARRLQEGLQTRQAPSLEDRKREKGLPIHIDRERLSQLGEVTFLTMEPTQARNPQTGDLGDGLLVTVTTDDGKLYTSFIANIVLSKDLHAVDLPFRAKLIKRGRTWIFA